MLTQLAGLMTHSRSREGLAHFITSAVWITYSLFRLGNSCWGRTDALNQRLSRNISMSVDKYLERTRRQAKCWVGKHYGSVMACPPEMLSPPNGCFTFHTTTKAISPSSLHTLVSLRYYLSRNPLGCTLKRLWPRATKLTLSPLALRMWGNQIYVFKQKSKSIISK